MAGFGSPPKPPGQSRTRHTPMGGGKIRRISASDHASEVPEWPLTKPSKRELEFWTRLWHTPVSAAWEILGWNDAVARYARLMALAEAKEVKGIVLIEVRQLEDRLGLSPMALLRLRWEIVDDEAQTEVPSGDNLLDIRQRIAAVD